MRLADWKESLLGEVVNLKRGYDLPHSARSPGPFPVVSSSGVTDHHSEAKVKGPGVVTGRYGTLGQVFFVESDYWPLNTSLYVQDFKGNDPRFVSYFLSTLNFGSQNAAGAVPGINRNHLHAIAVRVPPHPIQRRIAGILSAYDELIENSQRRIKSLEAMARTLYREWFVHFRFPGHESTPRIPSPLGEIPQGWEVLEFRHLFDIRYGKTLPKTEISDSGPYPVYGAGDVIGFYDKMLCPSKCALVTSRGNGSGTVWRTREAAFVTNNSLIMLPRDDRSYWDYSFVELLLKHANVMEAKTGSAQPQVTIENLNYVKAVVPTKPLVEKCCAFVTPIYERVDSLFQQIQNLRRTRDLLLPRLLSGQIDVEALAS